MRRVLIFYILLISIIVINLSVNCSRADEFTPYQAKDMATRAAALIERIGIREAHRIFHDPASGFLKGERGELYVFVLDFQGVLLFHPRPDLEGRNGMDWRDQDGNYYVKQMVLLAAKRGQGWVKYLCWDPKSGTVRPKVSYVIRVGHKKMLAGAGIFLEKGDDFYYM